jgi:Tol biopolymer transport system component/DNA-binding winged helix-turn-helix (wHTH) protein
MRNSVADSTRRVIRFDNFLVDLVEGQLRKDNHPVKLQDLPFRLLVALLERPGEVVSREELRTRLWGDTVVDFDDGLHTAVKKLRDVLGDSASHPRYIETVPRRGYRFLGTVQAGEPVGTAVPAVPRRSWVPFGIGALALVGLAGMLVQGHFSPPGPPTELVPLTSYPGLQRSPALSPDGKRLAFVWVGDSGGNFDIYTQNIDGTSRVRLTRHPSQEFYPAWSPDGKTIAFVRDGQLTTIPADGGTEQPVTTASGPGVSWSPDSRTIAISDSLPSDAGSHSIFLVLLAERTRAALTFPTSREDDDRPAFSPDGKAVGFIRKATTTTNVYRVPSKGGQPVRVALVGRPLRGLAWSPDGGFLLMATGKQAPGLLSVPANERDTTELDRVEIAGSDVWELSMAAPPGTRNQLLAYGHEKSNWDISGMAIGGTPAPPTPLAASSRVDQAPSFSPDGKRLAFCSARSGFEEIWVANADGSEPRQLTRFGAGLSSSPRWSPDGKWIAFDTTIENNRDIYIAQASGGAPKRLTSEAASEGQPSWSRDGLWIYFMSDRSGSQQIWKIPAQGGSAIQITRQGGYQAFEAPDRSFVYYTRKATPGIWRVPVNGGAETLINDAAWQNLWAIADDGAYYFDLAGLVPDVFDTPRTVPVKKVDLGTGKVTLVTTLRIDLPNGVPSIEVRRDGKYIAWVSRREHTSELMLVKNPRLKAR